MIFFKLGAFRINFGYFEWGLKTAKLISKQDIGEPYCGKGSKYGCITLFSQQGRKESKE
jgi:hypothetical protein